MTYVTNVQAMTMNLAVQGLYLIGNRIDLIEDEAHAIASHDGIYPGVVLKNLSHFVRRKNQ
ncbi:MAG: hypothetical protein WC901_04975 [Candidatus Margulisiibacteriota bacterium]